MITANTILSIIELSLGLINQTIANSIRNEIAQLRTDYATEMGKPYALIDDASLYSIGLRLDQIVQLYSTAVESANTANSTGQTVPVLPLPAAK